MRRRTSRLPALVAGMGLVLTSLVLASPASAAPVVDLRAESTTVTAGQDIQLSWTSTDADPDADAVRLVPSGAWPDTDSKNPNGNENVKTEAGFSGPLTFTLTASDDDDESADDPFSTVTVIVTPAEAPDVEVTPTAPVSDDCTFAIPDLAGVTYLVDLGMELETTVLDPDEYRSVLLADDDGIVTIVAEAADGFVLAAGAQTTFRIQASDSCLDFEDADVVDVSAACESVTFTNTSDVALSVLYGDEDAEETDDDFTLAAGATRTVESRSSTTAYLAYDASLGDFEDILDSDDIDALIDLLSSSEFGSISVPQNCTSGNGSSHPTVAPAAGA